MEGSTLASRASSLYQKSKRALRLYSSPGRFAPAGKEIAEAQLAEWRSASSDLVEELAELLSPSRLGKIGSGLAALRDKFYGVWRAAEADLYRQHKELVEIAESGDYVRAALLAPKLAVLKARVDACRAVCNELDEINKNRSEVTDDAASFESQGPAQLPENVYVLRARGQN